MSLPPVTVKTTKIDWNKNQGYFFKKTKDWDISNNVVFYPYRAGADAIRLAFNSRDFCIAARNLVLACVLFVPVAGAIVRPIISRIGDRVGHRDLDKEFVELNFEEYFQGPLGLILRPWVMAFRHLERAFTAKDNCICKVARDLTWACALSFPLVNRVVYNADYYVFNGPKAPPKLDLIDKTHVFGSVKGAHHWAESGFLCKEKGFLVIVTSKKDSYLPLAYHKNGNLLDIYGNKYDPKTHDLIL